MNWRGFFRSPEWEELKIQLKGKDEEITRLLKTEMGVDSKDYSIHDLRRIQLGMIDMLLNAEKLMIEETEGLKGFVDSMFDPLDYVKSPLSDSAYDPYYNRNNKIV